MNKEELHKFIMGILAEADGAIGQGVSPGMAIRSATNDVLDTMVTLSAVQYAIIVAACNEWYEQTIALMESVGPHDKP